LLNAAVQEDEWPISGVMSVVVMNCQKPELAHVVLRLEQVHRTEGQVTGCISVRQIMFDESKLKHSHDVTQVMWDTAPTAYVFPSQPQFPSPTTSDSLTLIQSAVSIGSVRRVGKASICTNYTCNIPQCVAARQKEKIFLPHEVKSRMFLFSLALPCNSLHVIGSFSEIMIRTSKDVCCCSPSF
jgi:hypothetical protein